MTQPQNDPRELIILPSLKARRSLSGALTLTQKFLDGAAEYAHAWPGPVTVIVEIKDDKSSNMDQVEVMPENLEIGLELRPQDTQVFAARLAQAAVVLAFLTQDETETAAFCKRSGIPIVFITEYTPQTEVQIVKAATRNPVLRLRRKLWIRQSARKRLEILRKYSTGLQCSGKPTYDLYKSVACNPMLFFDNRVRSADILDDAGLAETCNHLKQGAPLRLIFGGRLIAMKGVLELPRVARALDRLKVPYRLDIYGSGVLEDALRNTISQTGLSDRVAVHPPMDFQTGWIPLLKRAADIFVCCHPQGDPSSTYPEVMSCGVPIIGYNNEAFAGIVQESGAGRAVPMHDAPALAAEIAQLDNDRQTLCAMSQQGRDFARDHCFETTFNRRVEHLINISRLPDQTNRVDPVSVS